jgi:hypothetical protein
MSCMCVCVCVSYLSGMRRNLMRQGGMSEKKADLEEPAKERMDAEKAIVKGLVS